MANDEESGKDRRFEAGIFYRQDRRNRGAGRLVTGLLLMALGVGFLLDQQGWVRFDIGRLWPVALIVIGLGRLLTPGRCRGIGNAFFLPLLGVLFLGINYHWHDLTWANSWTVILVIAGLGMVMGALFDRRPPRTPDSEKDHA